jgi:hypothetical protein
MMRIRAKSDKSLSLDDLGCKMLASTRPGCPGVTNYTDAKRDTFVWCDKTGTPRGALFIMGEDGQFYSPITGSPFTIFVHPAWRRKGIATKLYYAASDYYHFVLDNDYLPAGAAWARSILKREEGLAELPYVRIYIQMPEPELQAAIAAALRADLHKTQRQIAKEFGARISHVRKIAKQNGISRKRHKGSPPLSITRFVKNPIPTKFN